MSYISFDKKQLINLEFTLNREILRSNRSGAFSATTLIGCNTRKYHGLLVVSQPQLDVNNHVLLSNIDETIIENKEEFHLGVHMYANNVFAPRGHKYLRDFSAEPIPKLTYQIGSTVFTKELIFVEHEARVMIRYAVVESSAPVTLRVLPFLAFRNVHMLTHENHFANRKFEPSKNGSSWQLYENYSRLFLQFSREVEYTHIPHWYYNMFYIRECERGYDALEDQYVPGFFELPMREGNSVVLSAGLEEANPSAFKRQFNAEVKNRTPRNSFENCLINSAQQFVVKDQNGTRLWAGFPWFGVCSRDTFLSLPGLILTQGDEKSFREALDYLIERMEGPFFPHKYYQNDLYYTAVDSPLWFIWNLQKYEEICGVKKSAIWKKYKNQIITILESYINGADFNVKMQGNGLLYAGNQDLALTWMNVFSGERPWTARYGLAIEVNALWYNALKYACDLAGKTVVDKNYVSRWKTAAEKIEKSFPETFYDSAKGQFYDFVNEDEKNTLVRPNMLIAAALPYSPMTNEMRKRVFDISRSELLTIRGIRSLSPNSDQYHGMTIGNHQERERAYHQGTVFPWLIGFYADLAVKVHGKSSLPYLEDFYNGFEPVIKENGIGSISEIYDGDPPHEARGCISQSTSVAALLYLNHVIMNLRGKENAK